jgi:hypothetical protein
MTPAREHLKGKLERVTHSVRRAGEEAMAGRIIQLGTLEADVATICSEVLSLPPGSARELQPAVAELIAALDALALQLGDFRDRIHNG